MRKVCLAAVAVVLLGICPLLASEGATLTAVLVPGGVSPETLNLGFFASIVTLGHQDPALPCFNCVNGATQISLGLAAPISVIHQGTAVNVSVTGQDVAYSGTCTFTYNIRVSSTSTPIQTGSVSGSCYPSVWLATFPTTIPNAPGRYLLQGEISTNGSKTQVQAPLVISQ